jgi:uncharacterized protein YndB with AHSA1/START domain
MSKSTFVYVTYIRTTPEKLFAALTQPEFTRQYWAGTWQDCDWKQGASWKLMAPDGRLLDGGEVLEIEPNRRVVLKWRNEKPALKEEGYSRMTWLLEPQGEMVKLTVTHEMDQEESMLIKAVSGGWPLFIASLKSLLETGASFESTRRWPEKM